MYDNEFVDTEIITVGDDEVDEENALMTKL